MFSDFKMHVAGIPQIVPEFGKDKGNVMFRNANGLQVPEGEHDFGRWEFLEFDENKYAFRTSPLRNVSLQSAFFHNGAYVRLEDAVRFHLDTIKWASTYDPAKAGIAGDLQKRRGPSAPVLARLDPKLKTPVTLTSNELRYLMAFLTDGLLDARAKPSALMQLIPLSVPSGESLPQFQAPSIP
jgi:cytochrome c peroxidase